MLHGVTGSGKTEVYLQLIAATRALGEVRTLLVPEIAMTLQMLGLFKSRLHDDVAVMYSRLSDGERFDTWHPASPRGGAIVVGGLAPRSSPPWKNLGLIILDEEHETTYKQAGGPTSLPYSGGGHQAGPVE